MRYRKALGQGMLAVGLSVLASVAASAVLTAVTLIPVGVGFALVPRTARWLRSVANQARQSVGLERLEQVSPEIGFGATQSLLTKPTFWNEVIWGSVDWITGAVLALLPLSLLLYAIFGALVQPFVWKPIDNAGGSNWYAFIHVHTTFTALLAVPLAVCFGALGLVGAPWLMEQQGRLTRFWLAPSRAELAQRVARLTDSRAAATDSSAAELRRIERDLHDGAQARLVAMGMTLDSAGRTLKRDPEAAYEMILAAREASSKALGELRDLVRGIHPPVIADRGLVDAVRALALDSAMEVWVEGELTGRPPLPVESAAYFAVSEVLANAAKHAGATLVTTKLSHDGERLWIVITDDGQGGATSSDAGGLSGIARRLSAFDGTIVVDSPQGGPTVVQMEVPCVLSSPKTSSS